MAFSQQNPYQHQEQPPSFIKSNHGNPAAFLNLSALPDETHHPPYIPPLFQVLSLEPAPVEQLGGGGGVGLSLQWNNGFENNTKEVPKEQDFLEDRSHNYLRSNSQMSSMDLLQPRTVSTGLGLSLANNYSAGRLPFSGDLISPVADAELNRELQRQDEDVSNYLRIQGENLRHHVLEKLRANQMQTLSSIEERVHQKLREKEAEVETFKQKNYELEMRMEKLALEAAACQQRAQYNEAMVNNLKLKLHMALAQNRDEGCGDSEVDDSASCCNGRMFPNDGTGVMENMRCKVCRINKVCILVLPCKHLCLCKECDSKLSSCPLCHTPKYIGLEVYM